MAQTFTQTQSQQQTLTQTLSPQQLLQVRILELPLNELEERVRAELDDNPALETETMPDDESTATADGTIGTDADDNGDYDQQQEMEERQDQLEKTLTDMTADDDMPLPSTGGGHEEHTEMVYGETRSFSDLLDEQIGEQDFTPRQRQMAEYIVGSLDDDGYLRRSLLNLSDGLLMSDGLDVSEDELAEVLQTVQTFDPAGIAARNLQECLLLQIERRDDDELKPLMRRIITDEFDEFRMMHWEKIASHLGISQPKAEKAFAELRRLNPKPGSALSEAVGISIQQITPDFIVDTADDGTISFSINNGWLPTMVVSEAFSDIVQQYQGIPKEKLTRQEREAQVYAKNKVDAAQGFIDAVRQRHQTMYLTMRAIIGLQRKFFEEGDESLLRPMILKDVAERTGLDISTVSRVSNSKYVQTRWGTYPLRFFFTDGYTTDKGEELSTREIKLALKDIIENEDKHKPMSDERLTQEINRRGYPIARRTVAKYREQLGFPVARLRK